MQLLDRLDREGVQLRRGPDGRVVAEAAAHVMTDELIRAMRVHHDELAFTVWAQPLGHTWAPCDQCGAPVLTKRGEQPCRMTPGCEGHHVNRKKRSHD